MTGHVIWMRHGTCHDGQLVPSVHVRPGSPLTDQGRQQARDAADRLGRMNPPPAQVVSSPLPRARDTAAVIADRLNIPMLPPVVLFAEWRAPDCALGLAARQYPEVYRAWREIRHARPETALPGGESLANLMRRADQARRQAHLLADRAELLVIVSHRVLIGSIAALHSGHRSAASVFASATRFGLAPTAIWTAGPRRLALRRRSDLGQQRLPVGQDELLERRRLQVDGG